MTLTISTSIGFAQKTPAVSHQGETAAIRAAGAEKGGTPLTGTGARSGVAFKVSVRRRWRFVEGGANVRRLRMRRKMVWWGPTVSRWPKQTRSLASDTRHITLFIVVHLK